MAETAQPPEGQPNQEALALALKVGDSLLHDYEYSRLNEEDLHRHNIIPQEQTFTNFMMDRLGLNRSLQPDAVERVTSQIPAPQDTEMVYQALERQILTPDEELTIRRRALGEDNNLLRTLENLARPKVGEFARRVLDAADIWRKDNDSSFDPDQVTKDPGLLAKILERQPQAIRIEEDDNRYFALLVPRKGTDGLAGLLLSAIPPDIGEYVVVTDPDKNSELSTYLFNQPDLIRYYTAQALESIQSQRKQDLDAEFRTVSIDKYERTKKEVDDINLPLKRHASNLLKEDTKKKGEITLLTVFRDQYDVAAVKGTAPPKTDRVGSESGGKVYRVRVEGDNLLFSWGNDPSSEPDVLQVYARFNQESNKFKYGTKNQDEIVWKEHDYGSPIAYVENIFYSIRALSEEQRLRFGEGGIQEAQKVINQLLRTQSSVEFFSKSSDFGISGYPSNEIIINTDKRLHYVIDQFPKNPPSDPRAN